MSEHPTKEDRAGPWVIVAWALAVNAFIWSALLWQQLTYEVKPLSTTAAIGVLFLLASSVAGLVCMWRLR